MLTLRRLLLVWLCVLSATSTSWAAPPPTDARSPQATVVDDAKRPLQHLAGATALSAFVVTASAVYLGVGAWQRFDLVRPGNDTLFMWTTLAACGVGTGAAMLATLPFGWESSLRAGLGAAASGLLTAFVIAPALFFATLPVVVTGAYFQIFQQVPTGALLWGVGLVPVFTTAIGIAIVATDPDAVPLDTVTGLRE